MRQFSKVFPFISESRRQFFSKPFKTSD